MANTMPLILHKVLPLFLYPLNISIVLLGASVIFRRRIFAVLSLTLLIVCSAPIVAGWAIGGLEMSTPILSIADCPQADAVIMLGGILGPSRRAGEPEWHSSADRFEYAVRLYKAGKAPRLIISSAQLPWQRDRLPESALLLEAALQHGIPRESILLTRVVGNTADEARAARELLTQYSLQRIIVVTSAFHMSRAKVLFTRAGLDVVPFPVDFETAAEPFEISDLVPSGLALAGTEKAIRERLGLLYYSLAR